MTSVFCCGFECGQLGSAGQHWELAGTGSISTSTVRSGARSLRLNSTAGNSYVTRPIAASPTVVARFYIFFNTLPVVDVSIIETPSGSANAMLFQASDSSIYIFAGAATGVPVTTGVWYLIDYRVSTGPTNTVIDATVNGVACGQRSTVGNTGSIVQFVLGNLNFNAATLDFFYDDLVISTTSADYPIGAGYVNHFVPTSDGTHTSLTTTTVKGTIAAPTAGGAITAATTDSFNWLNGVPLLGGATDNTRLINAQTAAATTYAEVKFGPAPGVSAVTVAPRAVEVITVDREASTATCNFITRLNDNGTTSDIVNRGTVAGVITDRYETKHYATAPTGGAWTAASSGAGAFNNIRARFGYSSDATPDVYWRGIMIEAEFAPPVTTTKKFGLLGVG